MSDPLEDRLKRLRPAPLPNDVMSRLIAARPQPAATPPSLSQPITWLQWAFKGAGILAAIVSLTAVAVKIIHVVNTGQGEAARRAALASANATAPQPTRIFLPVEQHNYLVRTDDLGIVAADSPHPVRLVRAVWLDDATFRGTDGTSRARLVKPREQIIPVSLETY